MSPPALGFVYSCDRCHIESSGRKDQEAAVGGIREESYTGHGSWLLPRGQSRARPRERGAGGASVRPPGTRQEAPATAPARFLGNEFQLVFPNRLIMTQFESNDAILKGIISSQLAGSATLQLQPMRLLIVAWFGAARRTPARCVPAPGCTFFLGIPHPIHPSAAHASASLQATRCGTEGQCVFN